MNKANSPQVVLTHFDILWHHFELRAAKNAHYSLRAFARDLNFTPSHLSDIMNKKKGLSATTAKGIAEKLDLNWREKDFFILSVEAMHARDLKRRAAARAALDAKKYEFTAVELNYSEFDQAHHWYHMAILELVDLDDCDHSIEWFAKKLNLSAELVKVALERLISVGWLSFQRGKYRAEFVISETKQDLASSVIKKYHEEILHKAGQSLYTDGVSEREFSNMTLAFSKSKIKEAKAAIREFQNKFVQQFYTPGTGKDSVYQLSVQLFRLDAILKEKRT